MAILFTTEGPLPGAHPPSLMTRFSSLLRGFEEKILRLIGSSAQEKMEGKDFLKAFLSVQVVSVGLCLLFQRLQGLLPGNHLERGPVPWSLAINTAISFVTNTNWLSVAPETTFSLLTQIVGFGVQQFLSPACGLAVFLAVTRSLSQDQHSSLGHFWQDLLRSLCLLLFLSLGAALLLNAQGVLQTLSETLPFTDVKGGLQSSRAGPVASQTAIQLLGTNGGSLFQTGAAHPLQNPTPWSNLTQIFLMLLLPSALPITYGQLIGHPKHGRLLFGLLQASLLAWIGLALGVENQFPPSLEGKELRFTTGWQSLLFQGATTFTSCGSTNASISSFPPLTGGLMLANMLLGGGLLGGVGSGMMNLLLFICLTVFLGGLMVGKAPEYLGKKITPSDMGWILTALLLPSCGLLIAACMSLLSHQGLAGLSEKSPQGLFELLYTLTSTSTNNGSSFGRFNADTPYYAGLLTLLMSLGRWGVFIPLLILAGDWAPRKKVPPSLGTLEIDTPLFGCFLFLVILLLGGLTFLPPFLLGPITVHFLWPHS